MRRVAPPPWSASCTTSRRCDPIYIDGRAVRLRFAARMLASAEPTVEEDITNAEEALRISELCDEMKLDDLETAGEYRNFMEAASAESGLLSREWHTRFLFVVYLLRRTPRPTMH